MIDPKLNELPVDRGNLGSQPSPAADRDVEAERIRRSRAGLSINDTIAGDTLASVGSRGVDVSGVEAGAGAGSGTTVLTPSVGSSPAPDVLPGSRATGTTPRATSASGRSPAGTAHADADTPGITGASPSTEAESDVIGSDEIASRAYECWRERGCPQGSPEVDWHRAIQDLRERRRSTPRRTSGASA